MLKQIQRRGYATTQVGPGRRKYKGSKHHVTTRIYLRLKTCIFKGFYFGSLGAPPEHSCVRVDNLHMTEPSTR